MSPRAAAGVLAAVVFVVALFVGFSSHSIPLGFDAGAGHEATMECGSALAPQTNGAQLLAAQSGLAEAISGDDVAATEQQLIAQCGDAVSTPRLVTFVLGGAAVLVLLFLWLTAQPSTRRDEAEEPAEEPSV